MNSSYAMKYKILGTGMTTFLPNDDHKEYLEESKTVK